MFQRPDRPKDRQDFYTKEDSTCLLERRPKYLTAKGDRQKQKAILMTNYSTHPIHPSSNSEIMHLTEIYNYLSDYLGIVFPDTISTEVTR